MATFSAQITAVAVNGPYAYVVFKDGVGEKAADNVASITAALDAVRTDIGGLLAGETVKRVAMTVTSS